MRADTLTVLGVLKVATAFQVQRITRPGARDNKVVRNALNDLARRGLVVSDGNTQGPPGIVGRARTTATAVASHAAEHRDQPLSLVLEAHAAAWDWHAAATARSGPGRRSGASHARAAGDRLALEMGLAAAARAP